ncbi:MAG: rod shape-determining protein MreD [Bacteroidales bacterium]|nr:rod shape-determining protein MreD [Bacteroidales bacterium]
MTLNILLKYIGRFVFLILLQVLLLNNINLTEYGITPYFYIILIILLPFETPGWVLLLFAFFLGLTIDMFCDTGGAHASASVFIAYIRPLILRMLSLRDGYATETSPVILHYGFSWFYKYAGILTIIHHFVFYFMYEFSFAGFMLTLFKVLITSLLTLILVLISQYLIFRK